jgi:hypothetical protein
MSPRKRDSPMGVRDRESPLTGHAALRCLSQERENVAQLCDRLGPVVKSYARFRDAQTAGRSCTAQQGRAQHRSRILRRLPRRFGERNSTSISRPSQSSSAKRRSLSPIQAQDTSGRTRAAGWKSHAMQQQHRRRESLLSIGRCARPREACTSRRTTIGPRLSTTRDMSGKRARHFCHLSPL